LDLRVRKCETAPRDCNFTTREGVERGERLRGVLEEEDADWLVVRRRVGFVDEERAEAGAASMGGGW
jgi:hypothetical protein